MVDEQIIYYLWAINWNLELIEWTIVIGLIGIFLLLFIIVCELGEIKKVKLEG